jgi:hypothetical protein
MVILLLDHPVHLGIRDQVIQAQWQVSPVRIRHSLAMVQFLNRAISPFQTCNRTVIFHIRHLLHQLTLFQTISLKAQ